MRTLLALVVLLFAILFYNRPSASRQRNLAFERARPVQASGSASQAGTPTGSGAVMSAAGPEARRDPARAAPSVNSGFIRAAVGYRAPEMSAITLDGFSRRRLESFQGRNVVLYVWATWCPQCRKEMPSIERLYREFRDENVAIVAVEASSDADEIRRAASDGGFSFEILRDDEDRTTFRNFNVPGYPYTAVIDRDGVVRAVRVGYSPDNHAENVALLRDLLAR